MEPRIISGDRIRQKRGSRSVREIAEASNGAFTHGALCHWESGKYQPRRDKVAMLLKALNCNYEDITETVSLAIPK